MQATDDGQLVTWEETVVLSEELDLPLWVSKNVVRLLDEDNTVPFIARYRKEQTNNMEADKIREFKAKYEELRAVQAKIASVMKTIEKLGKLTSALKDALRAAHNMTEVEHLYAPYKSGSKRTLAERARELGLEPWAVKVLQTPQEVNLTVAVQPEKKGLSSMAEVETGIKHIIADMIAKDKDTMDEIRRLCQRAHITLQSAKSRAANKQEQESKAPTSKDKKTDDKTKAPGKAKDGPGQKIDVSKFELYFNFSVPLKFIKPHQVLAINRGENLKVLTVKINIPDYVKNNFTHFCQSKWIRPQSNGYIRKLVCDSVEDAYDRLIQPLMVRHYRSELSKTAERAAVDVFASNLKRLLLTPPVRGKVVLGVDPGFRNGCKFAVTSSTGQILDTGVAYIHGWNNNNARAETSKLREAMLRHRCETIAIGNGTACRETETFFSEQIQQGTFAPLNVMFCIVNENGASIYSASEEAGKEMPDLDVSIRGAVSIARRLQDPLTELVKIEPKHIGVGMYQHDVSENQLKGALDGVVQDCVSLVGVDLNVCTETILRHIAGLNSARAKKIVDWREIKGGFISREQLKTIKGLGPKTFEQCAGFVRILPATSIPLQMCSEVSATKEKSEPEATTVTVKPGRKRKSDAPSTSKAKKRKTKATDEPLPNALDRTSIHPESYTLADRLLEKVELDKNDIGQPAFIRHMQTFIQTTSVQDLASQFDTGVPTMQLIVDGLSQPLDHDLRQEFEKPLFKKGLTSLDSLKSGTVLTGRVTNTTHFGAFVDIGVGINGLIHTSKMRVISKWGKPHLDLGDRVEVEVENVELQRKRIGLRLLKLL